ncbi:MAG TPA: hypothetical protein IAC31_01860 [Candidatus Faecousia intestinigallinarum]|nr:hypothetical protein [Candidatus Faecousia intestinigallinarum]
MEEKRIFFLKIGLSICLLAAMLSLLLWAGNTPLETPPQRFVTQVDITSAELHRQYTSPEKMDAVLNYLRQAPIYPLPQGAAVPSGQEVDFLLTLSDGSQRRYRQQGGFYLRRETDGWKKLDEQRADMMARLLRKLPSDGAA